jgi:hypothetical protein
VVRLQEPCGPHDELGVRWVGDHAGQGTHLSTAHRWQNRAVRPAGLGLSTFGGVLMARRRQSGPLGGRPGKYPRLGAQAGA